MATNYPIYPDYTRDSGATLKTLYDGIAASHRRLAGAFVPYGSLQFDVAATDVNAANDTITRADHGLFIADIVRFTTSSNALPTGISSGTNYWVIASSLSANLFRVSTASGGSVLDITAAGSGIHTVARTANMKAMVAKGFVWNGYSLAAITAQQTALIAAPGSLSRIDRLVIGNDFVASLQVITGTEAASPVAPAITNNTLPVAQITFVTSQTQIVNADFTDERAVVVTVGEAQGTDIASAGTINLDTATGNTVDITGTTAITAVTLSQGRVRRVRFTGILVFTHGASLVLPNNGNNIITAAGDTAVLVGYAAGVVRCHVYQRLDGRELAAGNIPQNSQSAAYTTVLSDAGKHILHPTADNNARTFTIDSNANVAYAIGTTITFVNQINTLTIAITSDTLTLQPGGTTGSITLTANQEAEALKVAATSWTIKKTAAVATATVSGAVPTPPNNTTTFLRGDATFAAPASGGFTLGTEQATTSGTTKDFTSIPAGTKKIIVNFKGVSSSGTDAFAVQLGDAGGLETTGYTALGGILTATPVFGTSTTMFIVGVAANMTAARAWDGQIVLALEDSSDFTWTCAAMVGDGVDSVAVGTGVKSLSAELTQLRLMFSGANSFDAGAVNIMYIG